MKICILLAHGALLEKGLSLDRAHITDTAAVYGYHLGEEFERRGIEVVYGNAGSSNASIDFSSLSYDEIRRYYETLNIPSADHVICTEQAFAYWRDPRFVDFLRTKSSGLVTTICDHDLHLVNEDAVFTARIPESQSERAVYVGWAADPRIFYPEKVKDKVTIFIDHLASEVRDHDHTDEIINSCLEFIGSRDRFQQRFGCDIEVIFLGPSGLESLDLDGSAPRLVWDAAQRRDFLKSYQRVPQDALAAALRRSDLFVSTHSESMGLPILEAGLAGCVVMAKSTYIRQELIRPLHHILWDARIPWEEAIAARDVPLAVHLAEEFSWGAMAERMLEVLTSPTPQAKAHHSRSQRKFVMSGGAIICTQPALVADVTVSREKWATATCSLVETDSAIVCPQRDAKVFGIQSKVAEAYHYIYSRHNKLPQPTEMSFGIFVRPGISNRVGIWVSSGVQRFRVQMDCVLSGRADDRKLSSTGDWEILDTQVVPLDDWFWCGISFRTDWGPRVGISIFALQSDGAYVFEPGARHPTEMDLYVAGATLQHGRWPLVVI